MLLSDFFKVHANDLANLLKVEAEIGKMFLTLVGDNGPDMNSASYVNTFYFGRIWQNVNLTKFNYPVGQSAFNPIEHAWAQLSNALTSVTIPAVIRREDTPPCKQKRLDKEKMEKNVEMLKAAAKTLLTNRDIVTLMKMQLFLFLLFAS